MSDPPRSIGLTNDYRVIIHTIGRFAQKYGALQISISNLNGVGDGENQSFIVQLNSWPKFGDPGLDVGQI
jgi:hypothetical protein